MLSQDTQDTLITCEMDADKTLTYNELLNDLELREISILRRMANKKTDPIHLREKVRNLGRTPEVEGDDHGDGRARHRQSQLKLLRRILKKSDKRDTRMWAVDVCGLTKSDARLGSTCSTDLGDYGATPMILIGASTTSRRIRGRS